MYKVHVGYNKCRKFKTLAAAKAFCSKVFEKTGVVLSITGGRCN
jgi:hypothetical protein